MKKYIIGLAFLMLGASAYRYYAHFSAQSDLAYHVAVEAIADQPTEESAAAVTEEEGKTVVEATAATQSDVAARDADWLQDEKEYTIQLDATKKSIVEYVERAVAHLKKNEPEQAFDDFMHNPSFATGALYLFVYDSDGTLYVQGDNPSLIWSDEAQVKDTKAIIAKARAGGGWVTYRWRNATKITYTLGVQKGKKFFVIGAGFYPHSVRDEVVGLVNKAVDFFNDTIKAGRPAAEAFSTMSYPMGEFVAGSLYLYALDFTGMIMAQGDLPGLIGQSSWNYKDAKGVLINQMIIEKVKKDPAGVWVSYVSKNSQKQAYAQKVTDAEGKDYFIACGYNPDADRDQVKELVGRGYQYLKSHGITQASREFTTTEHHDFRFGDLFLFVYDMNGKCLAHGKNRDFVGANHFDLKDEDGLLYVQDMIKKAKEGTPGWVNAKLKNSYFTAYVEQVQVGLEHYIIGSGLYALTRYETMLLLVKSGRAFLQANPISAAFSEFAKSDGKFCRGDLSLLVVDDLGRVFAYGNEYNLIWKNLIAAKDDLGKTYIKLMINAASGGEGRVSYTLNGIDRLAYVEKLSKDGKNYIIGSTLYKYTVNK